ncbi:MAG: SCP2 sterol-binding domain-containing protein [Archaeoglobaceae archaeon]
MKIEYEPSGLAAILGQLLEQRMNEEKIKIAKSLKGSLTIEAKDLNAASTIYFEEDKIMLKNEKGGKAVISTDFQTLNELASGKIGTFGTLRLMISGKLKIKGLRLVKRFQKLLT